MDYSPSFLLFLMLCVCPLHTAHTQKLPSYFERLQLASQAVQAAKADSTHPAGSTSEADILQETLQLLSSPVAMSQLVQSVSDDGSDSRAVVQEQVRTVLQATNGTVSQQCQDHVNDVVTGILERKAWAMQRLHQHVGSMHGLRGICQNFTIVQSEWMDVVWCTWLASTNTPSSVLDAFSKPLPGLTQGNIIWPGDYDQCRQVHVRVNATESSAVDFSGQYCTANYLLPPAPGNPIPVSLSIGLCAPDSCSSADLTQLLSDGLSLLNVTNTASVDCPSDSKPLDTRAIIAIVICSIFLFFMAVGTALDLLLVQLPKWRTQEVPYPEANGYSNLEEQAPLLSKTSTVTVTPPIGAGVKIFVAFSVYTNGSKLFSTSQASGSLTCIHGIRFLSMTWVVLGHVYLFPFTTQASANFLPYMQKVLKRWTFQAIGNATVSVDTFFVLSGLLVAYLSLKEMKKREGKLNWFLFYFHRFWRLTPVYMLVIMVYVCLSPYWGQGPLWHEANPDRDNCKTVWWTNLLYINNFVDTKKLCLAQSWYLANDMQFYILSPLIFVPFYFSPLFGMVSSIVFLLVTAIVPGVLSVKNHFPPGLLPGQLEGNETENTANFMVDFYMKPYNRMGPYVIGMLAGYFLYRTDCKLRIPKIVNLSLWAVAVGSAMAVLYGLYDASNGHPITVSVAAFYNAVNRQVWGLCVAWVIVACVTGNGGFVNTLLSWSAVVPLSRLTYTIYLLHIMMIEIIMLNRNTVFYYDDLNVVMLFLGILVLSYMAAVVTSLAFEAPMMALEKVLFHPPSRKDKEVK